jgi:N-acetyl-anhydromuramyl-L-alanine amidase AmpD
LEIIDIPASTSTYSHGRGGKSIEWIVIHYTGAAGTARNNGDYFAGGNRNASAHYFLDGNEAIRSVGDGDTAWAVGNFDMNQRSMSIEVCSDGEDFSDAEIAQLTELTRSLMDSYGIDADHVIRHHDVADHVTTGSTVSPHKDCPAPYVSGDPDGSKWAALHDTITSGGASETATSEEEEDMQCIIQPNGESYLVYFDGAGFHVLVHPDEVTALDMIYQQTHGGKPIPCFQLGTKDAPWCARAVQAVRADDSAMASF